MVRENHELADRKPSAPVINQIARIMHSHIQIVDKATSQVRVPGCTGYDLLPVSDYPFDIVGRSQ